MSYPGLSLGEIYSYVPSGPRWVYDSEYIDVAESLVSGTCTLRGRIEWWLSPSCQGVWASLRPAPPQSSCGGTWEWRASGNTVRKTHTPSVLSPWRPWASTSKESDSPRATRGRSMDIAMNCTQDHDQFLVQLKLDWNGLEVPWGGERTVEGQEWLGNLEK